MLQVLLTLSADKDLSPGWEQNSLDFTFMCAPHPGQRVFLQLCPAHERFMACGQHRGPCFVSFSMGGRSTSCQLPARYHCTQHGRSGGNSRKAVQVQSKSLMCYRRAGGKGAVSEETGASCRRSGIRGCCSSPGPPLPWVRIPDKPRGYTQEERQRLSPACLLRTLQLVCRALLSPYLDNQINGQERVRL